MGIESILNIGIKALTQARKPYVIPSIENFSIKSIESYGLKLEQLMSDECIFSRILNIEKFYEKLISGGLKQFNNPKLKQAFLEKIKRSNITLEELNKTISEVDSQTFVHLTNPLKREITFAPKGFQSATIPRPLEFREAELVLKKKYTPEEIFDFLRLRESSINGRQIGIEDADIIIKNKLDEHTMKRFISVRQQGFEPDRALYATYLKESEMQAITNEEIRKFLELKGKKITYQNSVGKTLEYILPPDEAAYCAKYDFNQTQVQRFAKLKNEYFAQETVRNSGIETGFEVKDILEWIKKDVSDQDIFNYNYILNNPQLIKIFNANQQKILTKANFINTMHNLCLNGNLVIRPAFESIDGFMEKVINKIINCQNFFKASIQKFGNERTFSKMINEAYEDIALFYKKLCDDDKLLFDTCIKVIEELKSSGNLNEYELKIADKILSLKYNNIPNQGKNLFGRMTVIFDFKIQTHEQIERYKKLINLGVTEGAGYIASNKELYDIIMRLTKDESLIYRDLNGNIQRLDIKGLALLSHFIDLTKMDVKPLLPNLSKWYKVCTGEKENVRRIFESARHLLQRKNWQIRSNLTTSDIEKISKLGTNPTDFYKDCLRLDENKNLIFDLGNKSFKVAIEKFQIEGKPAILIKDLEHDSYYVGYEGAITKIENSSLPFNKKKLQRSLFGFSKYSKKQDEIYADAIENFPVRIIDDKSECIIGKGRPALGINPIALQMSDSELVEHYQNVLRILKSTGNLSVENILRIMPKGSNIQINPFTTSKNGKMLYSISAEWKSIDGVKWQLRTHSTDLEHYMNSGTEAENSDWIFRLGHEQNGVAKFFEYNESERKFIPTGDFMGPSSRNSHVRIPYSPFKEENNLLDNIHFQNIMRQISS